MEPLAEHAVVLARRDGFRPELGDLYEHADDLTRDAGPAPGDAAVLLIDPWAVLQSQCRQVLARLDELDKPWVQVVVVWNRKDAEMAAAEGELRRALAEAMPSRLNLRGRATSLLASQGVPSLGDVTPALKDAMRHAARQYLKYAQGHPPGAAAAESRRPLHPRSAQMADENIVNGKIVTFYSYKGGTGRTMALANVGWILASTGLKVLVIDWDLDSPGLHRYFHPFVDSRFVSATPGVIELINDYAWAATVQEDNRANDWHRQYAKILPHAVSLNWPGFPGEGTLGLRFRWPQEPGLLVIADVDRLG